MINEEPDYWPRYTVKDHHRLRHQFSESEKIKKNWSQSMQDNRLECPVVHSHFNLLCNRTSCTFKCLSSAIQPESSVQRWLRLAFLFTSYPSLSHSTVTAMRGSTLATEPAVCSSMQPLCVKSSSITTWYNTINPTDKGLDGQLQTSYWQSFSSS